MPGFFGSGCNVFFGLYLLEPYFQVSRVCVWIQILYRLRLRLSFWEFRYCLDAVFNYCLMFLETVFVVKSAFELE